MVLRAFFCICQVTVYLPVIYATNAPAYPTGSMLFGSQLQAEIISKKKQQNAS